MFGFTIWLVIGGAVGWLASTLQRTDTQQAILTNIIVAIIGAYGGGAMIAYLWRGDSYLSNVSALAGALTAVGAVGFFKRSRPD